VNQTDRTVSQSVGTCKYKMTSGNLPKENILKFKFQVFGFNNSLILI